MIRDSATGSTLRTVFLRSLTEGECLTRKLRYATRLAADQALELIMMDSNTQREELAFYLCPLCDGRHLTSQRQYLTGPHPRPCST